MRRIKIAIVGIGNCASSLIQGIHYYRNKEPGSAIGLMHWQIGAYTPGDIEVVAAFDVDQRKVGRPVNEAIFAEPNCTTVFCSHLPESSTVVHMGRVLDGIADHMLGHPPHMTFVPSDAPENDQRKIVSILKESGAQILLNYLPVGSQKATEFYAECALAAGTALVNNIPVFIASDPVWVGRFKERGLPLMGDDIKSQAGATIIHRILTDLFHKRGVRLERTYQLNMGGNTDFLNMLSRQRLNSKKISKTEAVQAVAGQRLDAADIHIGPSDHVAWQKDNKVCFIRMEGRLFGDVPMNLELRLSVEDSPNSAGVAIDAIRCVKLALDRSQGGVLTGPCAFFYKRPLRQFTDDEAFHMTETFIHRAG
jgi:myo-inositol-1-phosphate synthase